MSANAVSGWLAASRRRPRGPGKHSRGTRAGQAPPPSAQLPERNLQWFCPDMLHERSMTRTWRFVNEEKCPNKCHEKCSQKINPLLMLFWSCWYFSKCLLGPGSKSQAEYKCFWMRYVLCLQDFIDTTVMLIPRITRSISMNIITVWEIFFCVNSLFCL